MSRPCNHRRSRPCALSALIGNASQVGAEWFPFVVEIGSQTPFSAVECGRESLFCACSSRREWTDRARKGMFPASHGAGDYSGGLLRSTPNQIGSPEVVATESPFCDHHRGCAGLPHRRDALRMLGYAPAVLGILSGSWSDELAARIPTECRVIVKVHRDEAGQKYRDQICRSLSGRCRVFVGDREVAHG